MAFLSLARGELVYHASMPVLRASLSNQTCGLKLATTYSHTSYDRYGNRTGVTATGTAADSSPIPIDGLASVAYDNATNRITATGFMYDAAGNQIRALAPDGNWLKYEYDAANRLRIVMDDSGNPMQRFSYGSTNARAMALDYQTNRWTIYAAAGGTTLAEYTEYTLDHPTWTKSYTYLGDSQLATVTPDGSGGEYVEFNHPDRLGTKLQTNQALGTSYEQNTLPFGTALNAESTLTTNNKRFTSYDRSNATGLDYAINRTYDSKQGRFTQVDPIGMSAASLTAPQTLNMYSYCANDPVNYSDPMGLFFGKLFKWLWKAIKIIIATVLAAIAVLAFSMGHVWAGIALATTSASIFAETFGLKSLQKWIAVASIALSSVRMHLTGMPTVPIFPFGSGEGQGLNPFLISFMGSVGAIANGFAQDKNKKRKSRKKPWCPPLTTGATFYGNYQQFEVYEKAVKDMIKDNWKEQGGWIYQNSRGVLRAVRKVRKHVMAPRFIYLDKPPVKGWKCGWYFPYSSSDFGPSGDDLHYVNGVAMASGDYLANYNQGVPGLVLTRTESGGTGDYTYGPARGFHGVGLPNECK